MGQISDIINPWRQLLTTPASFRTKIFHVESGSRASGRRVVPHEYPKRDQNYAEDMGLNARRFSFSGYLIYRPTNPAYDYVTQRVLLMKALEQPDAGLLVHPVFCPGSGMMVMCERYSMTETREKGGFTQFDMQFLEAGTAGNVSAVVNTVNNVNAQADNVFSASTTAFNNMGLADTGTQPTTFDQRFPT